MDRTLGIYEELGNTIRQLPVASISADRKTILKELILDIRAKLVADQAVKLNFICTHNSRRSQLSQIWAQTAAAWHSVEASCYSGGVEITAFNERAVETVKKAGFRVTKKGEENPRYFVFFSDDADPICAFSKLFDDSINPTAGFAAIMTCSHADENCPFIAGAEARIPVRYEDPKSFDDTPEEAAKYWERSMQIAAEMFYVFEQVKRKY